LAEALLKLEQVRYALRLAVNIKMVNPRSYAYGNGQILDVARKLGAWKKSVAA
jgi:hypothetical protein